MKSGYLDRQVDVSGVSGTGEVAEFTISTNGQVVVFWEHGFSYFPSLEEATKVHGHEGKTKFVILTDSEEEHCTNCHHWHNICDVHKGECPGCLSAVK